MKVSTTQRCWTAASIEFLSKTLGHAVDGHQQDWPFEVADPQRLNDYLALYADLRIDDDVRFTLADMIIQAFEDEGDFAADTRWADFLAGLSANVRLHAFQIWYWAAADEPASARWKVSPWMHDLLGRIVIA